MTLRISISYFTEILVQSVQSAGRDDQVARIISLRIRSGFQLQFQRTRHQAISEGESRF
jgi:hypothetical protein